MATSSVSKTPRDSNKDTNSYPIASMYGIFTYVYHKNQPNVGKYTIHGLYGYGSGQIPMIPKPEFFGNVEGTPLQSPPLKVNRPLFGRYNLPRLDLPDILKSEIQVHHTPKIQGLGV